MDSSGHPGYVRDADARARLTLGGRRATRHYLGHVAWGARGGHANVDGDGDHPPPPGCQRADRRSAERVRHARALRNRAAVIRWAIDHGLAQVMSSSGRTRTYNPPVNRRSGSGQVGPDRPGCAVLSGLRSPEVGSGGQRSGKDRCPSACRSPDASARWCAGESPWRYPRECPKRAPSPSSGRRARDQARCVHQALDSCRLAEAQQGTDLARAAAGLGLAHDSQLVLGREAPPPRPLDQLRVRRARRREAPSSRFAARLPAPLRDSINDITSSDLALRTQ